MKQILTRLEMKKIKIAHNIKRGATLYLMMSLKIMLAVYPEEIYSS